MSRKAERLFKRMRQSKTGWRSNDFHTLFLGFGFTMISGKKHDIFRHPAFPDVLELRFTVPRHPGEFPPGYAKDAVKVIELLQRLQSGEGD